METRSSVPCLHAGLVLRRGFPQDRAVRGTGKKGLSFEVVGRVPLPVNIITWPSCRTPVKFDASFHDSTSFHELAEFNGGRRVVRFLIFERVSWRRSSWRFERSGSSIFAGRDERLPWRSVSFGGGIFRR